MGGILARKREEKGGATKSRLEIFSNVSNLQRDDVCCYIHGYWRFFAKNDLIKIMTAKINCFKPLFFLILPFYLCPIVLADLKLWLTITVFRVTRCMKPNPFFVKIKTWLLQSQMVDQKFGLVL
jgi:hypothetical protein